MRGLFLPHDSPVSDDGLESLRQSCAELRWSVLGRQLSRVQLLGVLRSCRLSGHLDVRTGVGCVVDMTDTAPCISYLLISSNYPRPAPGRKAF